MLRTCLCLGVVFGLFLLTLAGCGGGGGSSPAPTTASAPTLQTSLSSYGFDYVTLSNAPAKKEIMFTNPGNATLEISSFELSGSGFVLDLDSGVNYCGAAPTTIAVGDSCAVGAGFEPTSAGNYNGTLTISSNDPDFPVVVIQLSGMGLAIDEPIIKINQVDPDGCTSSKLTAYVSVTDQLGYPISGLSLSSFFISEYFNGTAVPQDIGNLDFVENVNASISVALVLDYSSSITRDPAVLESLEDGVSYFINQLGANDEAEIIKFATVREVVQPFTSGDVAGKAELTEKLREPWEGGIYTQIYDAVFQAVADMSTQQTARRSVIVISDGVDKHADGTLSDASLQELIDFARTAGVPIFTIGIGAELDRTILGELSSETGGQYFDAPGTDSLQTIYQQQAELLFVDQYVLSYASVFAAGDSATLTAGVTLGGPFSSDSRIIVPCP